MGFNDNGKYQSILQKKCLKIWISCLYFVYLKSQTILGCSCEFTPWNPLISWDDGDDDGDGDGDGDAAAAAAAAAADDDDDDDDESDSKV